MPVRYKINVLSALKSAGFNTTRFRDGKIVSSRICEMLLHCHPGDILEYVEDGMKED